MKALLINAHSCCGSPPWGLVLIYRKLWQLGAKVTLLDLPNRLQLGIESKKYDVVLISSDCFSLNLLRTIQTMCKDVYETKQICIGGPCTFLHKVIEEYSSRALIVKGYNLDFLKDLSSIIGQTGVIETGPYYGKYEFLDIKDTAEYIKVLMMLPIHLERHNNITIRMWHSFMYQGCHRKCRYCRSNPIVNYRSEKDYETELKIATNIAKELRTMKIARTILFVDHSPMVTKKHVDEWRHYRQLFFHCHATPDQYKFVINWLYPLRRIISAVDIGFESFGRYGLLLGKNVSDPRLMFDLRWIHEILNAGLRVKINLLRPIKYTKYYSRGYIESLRRLIKLKQKFPELIVTVVAYMDYKTEDYIDADTGFLGVPGAYKGYLGVDGKVYPCQYPFLHSSKVQEALQQTVNIKNVDKDHYWWVASQILHHLY